MVTNSRDGGLYSFPDIGGSGNGERAHEPPDLSEESVDVYHLHYTTLMTQYFKICVYIIPFVIFEFEIEDSEQICAAHEILYNGYCLGVITSEDAGACDKIFLPNSYSLAIKSQEFQDFILSKRELIAASSSQLVIGLTSDEEGNYV